MIVVPENRLLVEKDKHPTASVFVRVRGNGQLAPQPVNSIRFLVANAVEGLRANYVTVVDNMGNVLSENVENDSLVGSTTTQLSARRNLEQYLARKAEGMLEKVLGAGQALVRVAAEINYDTITRSEEKFDPDGQVVKSQTRNEESNDSTSTSAGAANATGVSANSTTETNNAASEPFTSTRNKKTTGNIEYEISRSTSNVMQAAGGLRRLSAAVTVAARREGAGADRKTLPRTKDELDQLKRIVQSALGIEEGATDGRKDQITVEELPFNDQFATEVSHTLEHQEKTDYWLNLGKAALYPGIAAVLLLVLWRMFKRTPVEDIPIGIPLGQIPSNGNGNGNGHGFDWAREGQPGAVTVDVLNQLIRENPGNMTQAIRKWMTKGKEGK
jgi:flagellar M-ring protein FliF